MVASQPNAPTTAGLEGGLQQPRVQSAVCIVHFVEAFKWHWVSSQTQQGYRPALEGCCTLFEHNPIVHQHLAGRLFLLPCAGSVAKTAPGLKQAPFDLATPVAIPAGGGELLLAGLESLELSTRASST